MNTKLVIYDLDGTILNTIVDLKDSLNYSLSTFNLPTHTLDEVKSFVGNGIKVLIEKAVPKNSNNELIEKIFETFNNYYAIHCNDKTHIYDGIVDEMLQLKASGIKIAVVSNKTHYAVKTLCDIYFNNLVDFYLGVKDNIRKKPYPDSILLTLKTLNINGENAIYVGDSEVDIETAKNSNIKCLSVAWGYRDCSILEKLNAGNVCYSVKMLTKKILSI